MTVGVPISLLGYLKGFNRKERFFLVGWALGNPGFSLGNEFRAELQQVLKLDVAIPHDAFVAMDYHLEWLYASLHLAASGGQRGPHPNPACVPATDSGSGPASRVILGNPEDIDLLIAFETQGKTYLLLVEAKGATGFTNVQMASKVRRLTAIFGDPQVATLNLDPRLAIASPREPQGIVTTTWLKWMLRDGKPWWINMPFPSQALIVTRSDAQGHPSAQGTNWIVRDVTYGPSPPHPAPFTAGMAPPFNAIADVAVGQGVTYFSTVTHSVQSGTVRQIDHLRNRVLVERLNGRAGWMMLRTVGNLQHAA